MKPSIKECIIAGSAEDIYVNGTSNILAFPEYADVSKAKEFLNLVENRDLIASTVFDDIPENSNVSIRIGGKDGNADYSIITSKYKIGDNMEGVIGLIGPVRMDYKKAVSVIQSVTDMMNNKLLEITAKKEDNLNE